MIIACCKTKCAYCKVHFFMSVDVLPAQFIYYPFRKYLSTYYLFI